MNIENIDKAIALMVRVSEEYPGHFNMDYFQNGPEVHTIHELHKCGTTCCFSGFLNISSELNAWEVYDDILDGDEINYYLIKPSHIIDILNRIKNGELS